MATQNDFSRSFPPNAAMSAYFRVVVSPNGKISLADTKVRGIGIIQEDVQGGYWENPAVRLWGTGTCQVMATNGPITPGDTIYTAAEAGMVQNSAAVTNSITMGKAITGLPGAITGVIEFLPLFTP